MASFSNHQVTIYQVKNVLNALMKRGENLKSTNHRFVEKAKKFTKINTITLNWYM